MEIWVSELSKYIISVLMVIYTLECFLAFSYKKERKNTLFYVRQWFYLFAVQFFAFFYPVCEAGGEGGLYLSGHIHCDAASAHPDFVLYPSDV